MESPVIESPFSMFLRAALMIQINHYLLGFYLVSIVFVYNFLEMHFFQDLFTGFRGQPVRLTFNPSSQLYYDVVSKCKILHGRYLSTPWLCSPHLQTLFVHFFGNPPVVNYRRQIFMTSDGGTLAMDWVINTEVKMPAMQVNDAAHCDHKNPIMLIIPGLTSASDSAYIKHMAFKMAKHRWNVVICNHRGLGGVSITSDCFYSGGWTEDVRKVIDHLHCQYPEAPLFVVGTSIGANILVKYLGEDGINVPIVGAAAICSPWDLLICDRFISRRLVQRFYNKALTIGLKEYAYLHEAVLSRLSNWEGVKKLGFIDYCIFFDTLDGTVGDTLRLFHFDIDKNAFKFLQSRWVRDFDDSATRVLGNFETVDTYYRRCSSSIFVGGVMVPLLCISSLDDPVCSSEAIPYDECRLNNNVVLATTQHGGHLPFFEGLTANSVWWVRAVDQFFRALQSSPLSNRKKEVQMPVSLPPNPQESSIDHAPYIHVSEDGMVSAISNQENNIIDQNKTEESLSEEAPAKVEPTQALDIARSPEKDTSSDMIGPVKKRLNQLSCQNQKTLWLLAYIAIITTWPLVGSTLSFFLKKRFQNFFSIAPRRR